MHRAWIWQDNLRLYTDTVNKSPNLHAAKSELASALLRRGRTAEAEALLAEMQEGDNASSYINDDINLANTLLSNGDLDGARAILLPLFDVNPKKRYDLLQALLRINDRRINHAKSAVMRLSIQKESLAWLKEQQNLRPNAFIVYRIAKMQLAMGDKTSALMSFRAALARAHAGAHYRGAAEVFIARLEKELDSL